MRYTDQETLISGSLEPGKLKEDISTNTHVGSQKLPVRGFMRAAMVVEPAGSHVGFSFCLIMLSGRGGMNLRIYQKCTVNHYVYVYRDDKLGKSSVQYTSQER